MNMPMNFKDLGGPESSQEDRAEGHASEIEVDTAAPKKGWFRRIKEGLQKTSSKISTRISQALTHKKLDDGTLDELEDIMLGADLGPAATRKLIDSLRRARYGQDTTAEEVRQYLAHDIASILKPLQSSLSLTGSGESKPHVVLVVGVNGSGKTTTIGKLAHHWRNAGLHVRMVAGDTFRAAAVEQLVTWGQRLGVPVEAADHKDADAAGLVFHALRQAQAAHDDVVIIDTAGRLHTNQGLMEELAKIVRVIRKFDATAPHHCVMVLDATIGQNAQQQVQHFRQHAPVTGLIMTKLDGTARGGMLVNIAQEQALPIYAIGLGEQADDLRPFEAEAFAYGLMGVARQEI